MIQHLKRNVKAFVNKMMLKRKLVNIRTERRDRLIRLLRSLYMMQFIRKESFTMTTKKKKILGNRK